MAANGENTGKRWQETINDRDLITDVLWPQAAKLRSRFDLVFFPKEICYWYCHWLKYIQTANINILNYGVFEQVQRCAQDPTTVVITYKGEHTHSLSPLATAVMHGSSNQLISEGLNIPNFVADNQFTPFSTAIARISTSSSSITLDLTDNQPDQPRLQLLPAHLAADSLHLPSLSNDMGQALDYHNPLDNYSSIMQDSVTSIMSNPNFSTSLAVAIAGSLVNLGAPVLVMSKTPHATHFTDGSIEKEFV